MRWPAAFLLGLGLLAAGCRNCDLVEAELRSRESDLREARAELARAESHNHALQREVHALRQSSSSKITPEQASQTYTLTRVTLGRQTGGYDDDGCPGDEALQIILEPRDGDGHPIKAPGSLYVEALEISSEGVKSPLSTWEVGPEQLRRTWRNGLLSTGYDVILPWKTWPTRDRLRVIVKFTLPDGRLFEADRDVTVRGTPESYRKAAPESFSLPETETPLPPPRKVDPELPMLPPMAPQVPLPESSSIDPAGHWQVARPKPIHEAVQLLPPIPLLYPPGESP
jgi:hypothetical protein